MKKYFSFYEECILVKGKDRAAIYNLLDGSIYSFSKEEREMVILLKQGDSIDCISKKVYGGLTLLKEFIKKLEKANLGILTEHRIISQELVMPSFWTELIFFKSALPLNKVFIVYGRTCNKDCYFCDNPNYVRTGNCFGCYKTLAGTNIDQRLLDIFLEQIKVIGYNEINLVGGDILDDIATLKSVFEKVPIGAIINIFWSGDDIGEDVLELLQNNNVNLFVQVIATDEGTLKCEKLLQKIKGAGLKSNIIILLSDKGNMQNYEQIKSRYSSLVQNVYFDFVFHINEYQKFKEYIIPDIPRTSIEEYLHKRMYNPCLYGTIALQGDGMITSCPRMKELVMGSASNLSNTLRTSNYKKFWKLSKDKIDICNTCQFRYACNDCRFIQHRLTGNLTGMIECDKSKI